jgi:ATP-dependent protease Clp ATPase subunit
VELSFVVEPRPPVDDPSRACSFCLREVAHVECLVKAPAVSICDACIARCVNELVLARVKGWRRWWDLRPRRAEQTSRPATPYRNADGSCSFCGEAGVKDTIVGEHARICPPCVRLALDILREHGRGR